MSGPPRKPTALKILEGNPGHQKINAAEMKPPAGEPVMPYWLTPVAKKLWQELVGHLRGINLLTTVDGQALAAYCQAWSEFRRCTILLRKEGTVYEARQGLIPRPEVAIRDRAVAQMLRLAQEFGLTPSARGRMVVPSAQAGEDELDELLTRRRRSS